MARLDVNLPVRLTRDLPGLGLRSGAAGVVCAVWMSATAYEVEFEPCDPAKPIRVLLLEEQLDTAGASGATGVALRIEPAAAQAVSAVK